ncbi:MAG: hypothetical protein ACI8X5_002327 [Planctomycetota bacterium]|jgi:uncharacterized protein YcfL
MAIHQLTNCSLGCRVLSLLCLTLGACQSTDSPPGEPGLPVEYRDGQSYEEPSKDFSVESHLSQLIGSSKVVDGYRVVKLELCNQADEALSFAYSVEWLDRGGQAVMHREAVWTPLVIAAGERAPVEFRAPSPLADSWRLRAAILPK